VPRLEDDIGSWPTRSTGTTYGVTAHQIRAAERRGEIRAYPDPKTGIVHYDPAELEQLAQRRARKDQETAVGAGAVEIIDASVSMITAQTRHTESIFKTALDSANKTIQRQQDTITDLIKSNKELQNSYLTAMENEIRARNADREHDLKIRELELEADSTKRNYSMFEKALPIVGSLMANHAQPDNPGPLDTGIVGWIKDLSEETMVKIVSSGALGPEQLIAFQGLRDAPVPDGRFARWLASMRADQIRTVATSGALREDQLRNLLALHQAACDAVARRGGQVGQPAPSPLALLGSSSAPAALAGPAAPPAPPAQAIEAQGAARNVSRVEGAFKAFSVVVSAVQRFPPTLLDQFFGHLTKEERDAYKQGCDALDTLE
jgi:hypothetical protein